jgi:hypothetical protein
VPAEMFHDSVRAELEAALAVASVAADLAAAGDVPRGEG